MFILSSYNARLLQDADSCLFVFQIKLICNYILMPDIFQEAGLPLWLRPYEVLCTSSYTALIETIPDTV